MIEAQQKGMKTQSVDGVISIAIFDVSAYGMTNIRSMHPYLIFASCI